MKHNIEVVTKVYIEDHFLNNSIVVWHYQAHITLMSNFYTYITYKFYIEMNEITYIILEMRHEQWFCYWQIFAKFWPQKYDFNSYKGFFNGKNGPILSDVEIFFS
jgi:hypothetical protein